jgi:hypothetical protein
VGFKAGDYKNPEGNVTRSLFIDIGFPIIADHVVPSLLKLYKQLSYVRIDGGESRVNQ